MDAFYHDLFTFPLPEGRRFPIEKYRLLREHLLASGILQPEELHIPPPASNAELMLAHRADYVQRVAEGRLTPAEIRRIGFPWSPQLVERSRRSVGSSIAAAHVALRRGAAVNLAGGTHHAGPDYGAGYCVFNDVAVAIRVLQSEGRIRRAAVIDCDVHQGDGTAAIFADDGNVFTFSVHGEKNFPFRKQRSSLDIPLPDGAGDETFLDAVRRGLQAALEHRPEIVFYVAGADPYHGDRLGRLHVSREGLAARDALVLEACHANGLPLVITMGGGYAPEIGAIVAIHAETVRQAKQRFG